VLPAHFWGITTITSHSTPLDNPTATMLRPRRTSSVFGSTQWKSYYSTTFKLNPLVGSSSEKAVFSARLVFFPVPYSFDDLSYRCVRRLPPREFRNFGLHSHTFLRLFLAVIPFDFIKVGPHIQAILLLYNPILHLALHSGSAHLSTGFPLTRVYIERWLRCCFTRSRCIFS